MYVRERKEEKHREQKRMRAKERERERERDKKRGREISRNVPVPEAESEKRGLGSERGTWCVVCSLLCDGKRWRGTLNEGGGGLKREKLLFFGLKVICETWTS